MLNSEWRRLDWFDSDIFDGELAKMLIDRHFILGDLSKVIEEQLEIKEEDLRVCCDCGKMYSKDMVIELSKEEMEDKISGYRCLCCQDVKNTKDSNKNSTDYYRSILKELDEYKEKHKL